MGKSRKQVIRQKPQYLRERKGGNNLEIAVLTLVLLLGCYAVPLGLQLPTIRNIVAPSSSGSSNPEGSHFILANLT